MNNKRIIGRENAVEALASLCRDYRGTALKAIREGGEEVFIPANPENVEDMLQALENPQGLVQFESSNRGLKEPCYASKSDFLAGRNSDGTEHRGYLTIDVVSKLVVGLHNRFGDYALANVRIVKPLAPDLFVRLLQSHGKDSYCL